MKFELSPLLYCDCCTRVWIPTQRRKTVIIRYYFHLPSFGKPVETCPMCLFNEKQKEKEQQND